MRLRILHQGLILLLIPAALQGFLLVELYSSFEEFDGLSKTEEDISTGIKVVDQLHSLIARVLSSAWRATKLPAEPSLDPDDFRTRMYTLMEKEKQLVSKSAKVSEIMSALRPMTEEAYNLLKESRLPNAPTA